MDILKKNAKTGEVIEKICFVNGDEIKYEFAEPDNVSDGFHTFKELYEHRFALYIALCKRLRVNAMNKVWRSKKHSDGELAFGGEWFILGINEKKGEQITYHLPMSKWEECRFAETLEQAPEWDNHKSQDVPLRLSYLT
jgi:hypothetical protein